MPTEMLSAEMLQAYLVPWAIRLATALVILLLGLWLARMLTGMARRAMMRGGLDETLARFLGNIVRTVLVAVVIIAALDRLGVDTTSALAILGAAALAIGLALKDSLSNFSAGVMLILFRPFRRGDYVEVAGTAGTAEEITIFNTVVLTPDNRVITVPNGQVYSGTIVNYSAMSTRRVDLVFGIGYGDDIDKARNLILEVMDADERILHDPAPAVMTLELADSSVNIAVRPWVNSADYWAVRGDLLENVKKRFDSNGITIPFPQRDVHFHQVQAS